MILRTLRTIRLLNPIIPLQSHILNKSSGTIIYLNGAPLAYNENYNHSY